MLALRTIAALGLLLAGSCRTADVASANLDQLMREDNSFRYSGKIQSGVDYLLRSVIDPSWFSEGSILNSDAEEPLPNPSPPVFDKVGAPSRSQPLPAALSRSQSSLDLLRLQKT